MTKRAHSLYSPLECMLSDGAFHSGAQLAVQLGVSRSAIWKQLQQLKKRGVDVESCHTRGYRVVGGLDLLAPDMIVNAVRESCAAQRLSCLLYREVDSTNDLMAQWVERGFEQGFDACTNDQLPVPDAQFGCEAHSVVHSADVVQSCYVVAEQQRQGRGRQGKRWVMPFASGLCFSTAWTLTQGVRQAQGLSLVIGVAVADALVELGVPDIALKWPNDIWRGGRKLGGILVELSGDVMSEAHAVIGVGLNVNLPPSGVWLDTAAQAQLSLGVADMQLAPGKRACKQACKRTSKQAGADYLPLTRSTVLAAVMCHLEAAKARFLMSGFEAFHARWQAYDGLADAPVMLAVRDDVQHASGVAQGIDANGGLRVLLDDGAKRIFYGGEVSLRAQSSAPNSEVGD